MFREEADGSMSTYTATSARPTPTRAVPRPPRRPAQPIWGLRPVAVGVVWTGLAAVLLLGSVDELSSDLHQAGGVFVYLGGMAGLGGMYLALVQLLLISRIPGLERVLGQDGLVRWHRQVGPWPITLLTAHAVLLSVGFAQAAKSGVLHQFGVFLRSYPDVLAATVGLALMVAAGIVSVRALRRRMRRESWWILHLYMYLALALSFAHVLALGPTFVGHPANRVVWSVVWALTAGLVILYRFGLPVWRSVRHGLRVAEVRREASDVVSIVCRGRRLDRLPVAGGQFLQWRFLERGLWWQAHPYSLSAMPDSRYLRLTVRIVGDHTQALARLRPGTRVAIEGPYGALTASARLHHKVVLFAGGIGVTALRALLEDLPKGSEPVVLLRASSAEQLVFHDEVSMLVKRLKGSLHLLVGSRTEVGGARQILRRFVPDLAGRDVFACGPEGFVNEVASAARALGVRPDCVHSEVFSW